MVSEDEQEQKGADAKIDADNLKQARSTALTKGEESPSQSARFAGPSRCGFSVASHNS